MPALGTPEDRPITLGRYELVTPIGRGGMAEVHLAVQRGAAGFEKLVVLKLVHEHLASHRPFVEMLLDEARLAALIKHPNVVDIYELGEEAGRYFIAMEYLEGEPLLEVLRLAGEDGRRLDPLSTARVIADTAEGLDAAHRLKSRDGRPIELVHHDVSLGNIVVLYSGLVKLVDFGVAKVRSSPSGARVHGKLGYMSPEKLADRAVDRRSDIWSLGCVLWEALTLQRLFDGDTDADTVRQVLRKEIVPPSKIDPRVPLELDPIVARALDRDPDRRYQTAKELAADLEEVLRERKYGAKNDRIARHMEVVFAARIAARERVLADLSGKRAPSAETLEAAFGDEAPQAASTSAPAGEGPRDDADGDEPAHESTTVKTAPNPPDWKPAEAAATATATATAEAAATAAAATATAEAAATAPVPAPVPADPRPRSQTDGSHLSPGAFSQPRPSPAGRRTGPKPFSVATLLDDPDEPAEPIRPDEPLLPRFSPPSSPPSIAAPVAPAPSPFLPAPPVLPAPVLPAPPILPVAGAPFRPMRPLGPGEVNPFADDDDLQTVADVIPANPEASRSLQSEPSWTIARQSSSLGELQRWVQESRTPPRSRREAIGRWWQQLHQRVAVWAYHRRVPRWSPYAAIGVVLLALIVLIARCSSGDSPATPARPPGASAPATGSGEPRTTPPPAPADEEIEMTEEVVSPRR